MKVTTSYGPSYIVNFDKFPTWADIERVAKTNSIQRIGFDGRTRTTVQIFPIDANNDILMGSEDSEYDWKLQCESGFLGDIRERFEVFVHDISVKAGHVNDIWHEIRKVRK